MSKKQTPNRPAHRRLPGPRASLTGVRPAPAPVGAEDDLDHPVVAEIVRLHAEWCRASARPPLTLWSEWLDATEAWLAVVAEVGEAGALAGLPAAVQARYDRLDRIYSEAAVRRGNPAAHRKMGENFTAIFRLLADTCPAIDLEQCARRSDRLNPDLLGRAFIAGLGYPRAWRDFFPAWPGCVSLARELIPEAAEPVYTELARAHVRANLAGPAVERPQPGQDESWARWLAAIGPYADLPVFIGPGLVTSSAMLLALAGRFPAWLIRGGLVRFAWPDLSADPVLANLASITAMLFGLNGFYAGKALGNLEALAQIEAALEQASSAPAPARADPSAVWRAGPRRAAEST